MMARILIAHAQPLATELEGRHTVVIVTPRTARGMSKDEIDSFDLVIADTGASQDPGWPTTTHATYGVVHPSQNSLQSIWYEAQRICLLAEEAARRKVGITPTPS